MDDLRFSDLFISISVISGSWDGDSAMLDRVCITFERFSPQAGIEPRTAKLEVKLT